MAYISKFMNYIFALLLIISSAFSLCSCDEEESNRNSNTEASENSDIKTGSNDFVLPDSVVNEELKQILLSNICYVDTINDSTFRYSHRYGRRDEADSTLMYLKSNYDGDALSFFKSMLPAGEEKNLIVNGNNITYSIPNEGSITYSYEGSNDVEARIYVDFPEIPDIKEIIYIPKDLWPYNDDSSPFKIGSIWKNADNNRVYVCVKEFCGNYDKGIMMTFNGGWKDYYYNGFNMYTECATKRAWEKLSDLYTSYNLKFKQAEEKGAIPSEVRQGYNYTVGNHTSKYKFLYTRHYFDCVKFKNNKFEFSTFTIDAPWQEIAKSNRHPSSSFEFTNTKPSGNWKRIAY